jgi:hypothetical protein
MAKSDSKAVMAGVIKYHFWAVAAVSLIAGMVCWMMATSTLSDQYNRRVQKITGDLKKVQGIAGEASHPNQPVFDAVQKAREAVGGNVLAAWKELYDRQEKNNPWPKSLGEDFLSKIAELKPTAEIPENYREIYANFIRSHLPELQKIVSARRATETRQGAAPKPGAPPALDVEAIVDWMDADFSRLEKRFSGWTTTPSTTEVRLAQEDLWVYQALLRILRETNKNATSREYAAVKRIEAMEIGKAAVLSWSKAAPAAVRAGGAGEPEGGGGSESPAPDTGEAEGAGGGAPAAGVMTKELKELLDSRYVNEKGKPLPIGARGPFPQYKMMPVHMRLQIGQDRIGNLLMECANSTMPVEVRLVKLAEMSDTGSAARSSSDESSGAGHGKKAIQSTDMMVDVYGIISIFNPPPTDKAATDEAVSGSDSPGQPSPDGAVPNPGNPNPDNPAPENPAPAEEPPPGNP